MFTCSGLLATSVLSISFLLFLVKDKCNKLITKKYNQVIASHCPGVGNFFRERMFSKKLEREMNEYKKLIY